MLVSLEAATASLLTRNASRPMRLTLVIHSLDAGGSERVLSILANTWADTGHDVALITLGSFPDFYTLDPRVTRQRLGLNAASRGLPSGAIRNIWRFSVLRKALRDSGPDVIVSFCDTTNVLTLIASEGLGTPVVVSERTDFQRHRIPRAWALLRWLVYRRAAALVVPSPSLCEPARRMFLVTRVSAIPNPVLPPRDASREGDGKGAGRRVVAVGRLSPEKQFHLLLHAFARVAADLPDWSLTILGEGRARTELEDLAAELGIEGRVSMPGVVRDTGHTLRRPDLFVLTSRYEGFPNALLEAMAHGLSVVAFDCSASIRECLRDGTDGLLVPEGGRGGPGGRHGPCHGRRRSPRPVGASGRASLGAVLGDTGKPFLGVASRECSGRAGGCRGDRRMRSSSESAETNEARFAFGENWRRFLERLDVRRIERAEASLREALRSETLEGRSFLDVGFRKRVVQSRCPAPRGAGPLL